ncbi:MAG: phosphoglycerate kinase [Acidimicrobiales bacterium]|jgi:phosphoglycerate kinase
MAEQGTLTPSRGKGQRPFGVPTLEDLPDPRGRTVLVRADLDFAAVDEDSMRHDRRVTMLIPTLQWLLDRGASVTVCGHRGDLDQPSDAEAFSRLQAGLESICPGITVLPDLAGRGERTPKGQLVDELVRGQDVYVNEAFQWSWLPLASVVGPPKTLPGAAGLQLARDIALLEPYLLEPTRPFVVVLGSDQSLLRLRGLDALILRADAVLVGGIMSSLLLQAIGKQPAHDTDPEVLEACRSCYGLGMELRHTIHLPRDLVWDHGDGTTTVADSDVTVSGTVSDIGPATRRRYAEVLRGAGCVLWTGALGRVEDSRFTEGTAAVARALPSDRRVLLGGDGLLSTLSEAGLLQQEFGVLSATDSAVVLLKDGDLPGLTALRQSPAPQPQ